MVGLAFLIALLPPLFGLGSFPQWIYNALVVLVASCPCAIVISVPLAYFAGIGAASRQGMLIKGGKYLEALAKADSFVFDKTGTLTTGKLAVNKVVSLSRYSEDEILSLAAAAEQYSSHPIAQALRDAFGEEHDGCEVEDVEEIAGHGIRAKVDGRTVCIGNGKMVRLALDDAAAADAESNRPAGTAGTVIHVVVDGNYEGCIIISDVIKETSAEAIRQMKEAGVTRQIMLTGDGRAAAESVGSELGISEIYSELLPADKVAKVEELLEAQQATKQQLAFVGDGINDAPVLSRADIGIAMGALGSDAAIEAADVVLMDDDPLKIAKAIRISRKCMRIVHENIWFAIGENIWFAIGIKVLCLLLCAVGLVGMWAAIFADVGVMVLAVLNAIRTLFV